MTENNEILVLGCSDGKLRFLSSDSLEAAWELQYDYSVSSITLNEDKIFVGLANGSIFGKNRNDEVVLGQVDISNSKVSHLAY